MVFSVWGIPASVVRADAKWHVAVNGDDLDDGSQSEPFRTIQKAASLAAAGDTVYIHSGIYRETVVPAVSGTEANPLVFAPYPGDEVLVSGVDSVPSGLWTEVSNGVYKAQVQMSLAVENQVFRTPSSVGVWRDRSLNENHAVQTNGLSRPGVNDAVVLDGANDFLETPVGHLENGGFLMVGNFGTQGEANASVVLSWQDSGGNPGTSYTFENYSSSAVISSFKNPTGGSFVNYTDGVADALPAANSWHIIGGTVEGNGADSASFMRIGGNHNGSNFPDGSLRELIVWNESIPNSERQKLEGYLAHKWGLEGNLDVSHPYKLEPPAYFDPAEVSGFAAWYDAGSQEYSEEMMLKARWPNSLDVWKPAWATADSGTTTSNLLDSALPDYDWTGATIWIHQDPAWSLYGQQVLGFGAGSLQTENNIVWENHQLQPGSSYYMQGCLDALDIEGEWYYDSGSETLYVHTGGEHPGDSISIKTRMNAFVLDGRSFIELRDLHLKGATVSTDESSSHLVLDGLDVQYPYFCDHYNWAQRITGLVLNGDGHVFRNSELAWASGSGVVLNGNSIQVINNYIHDCDFIGSYAAPLLLSAETKDGLISHNTITVAGRSCISFSGPLQGFILQNNDLSHAGQLTQDLGMTYTGLCDGGGMEIRYNWVRDNDAGHIPSGIYFDHGSQNLLIHHNAIWGVERGGLHINQYAMNVLMFNNTVTSIDAGYLSKWGNEWPDDMYGCQLVNNVFSDVLDTDGVEIEIADNSTNYTGLVDYKYLTTGSEPVDSGRMVPGVTDCYVGSAPDRGAYESGGLNWQAGHDFRNEPVVNRLHSVCPYLNRVANSCFEWSTIAPWTTVGSDVALNFQIVNQTLPLTQTAMGGRRSLRLGAGTNRVEQALTNLLPNVVYEFRVRLRADVGASAVIGVSGSGVVDEVSAAVSGNAPEWSDTRIRFTTEQNVSSADIYVEKISSDAGNVYVDDCSVIYQFGYLDQDFNETTNGLVLNANGGILELTGPESGFSGIGGGASLVAENTSSVGNPEIRVDGIDMSRLGAGDDLRIVFDYYRSETAGAQTFFLQDTEAPVEGNGNGIQLQLNASDAGQVINYGSSSVIATLELGKWYRFEITACAESNAVKTFDLTIRDLNGTVSSSTALPFRYNIDSYNRIRWFFNTVNANVHGRFFLDNLSISGVASGDPLVLPPLEAGVDTDGDGVNDWNECLAGTNPYDSDSVFKVQSVHAASDSSMVVSWSSVSNKVYSVIASESLVEPDWSSLLTGIAATPPMNIETVGVGMAASGFFKIEVE